jgi:ribosomal protein L11 methylase PrmA
VTSARYGASFRDPAGQILEAGDGVIRGLTSAGLKRYTAYRDSGFQTIAESKGWTVRSEPHPLPSGCTGEFVAALAHERVEYISYPYEWPFSMLKAAALFHLELNQCAIEHGLKMVDASAYNVQFRGVTPVYIDILSFTGYVENEPWVAHTQFCEQFLNPLLLSSSTSMPFQALCRGSLEGISAEDVSGVLSSSSWFSLDALVHVHLLARATKSASKRSCESLARVRARPVPKSTVRWLMKRLARWIERLEPKGSNDTRWATYREGRVAYGRDDETRCRLVDAFVREHKLRTLVDVGCNDGKYSEVAVQAGAASVVAIDSDRGALEACYGRARAGNLPVLPLFQDYCNLSPDQGWLYGERLRFDRRVAADGLLAYAVLHHLCLGRNVPLEEAVASFTRVAPRGLIEFVPPDDERARLVTVLKGDLPKYDRQRFLSALSACARVVRVTELPDTKRCVAEYERG